MRGEKKSSEKDKDGGGKWFRNRGGVVVEGGEYILLLFIMGKR